MANHYTQSSFAINDITDEEKEWLIEVHKLRDELDGDFLEDNDPREERMGKLLNLSPDEASDDSLSWGWTMDVVPGEHPSVLFYGEECPELEAMALVLRSFLAMFRPTGSIGFSWGDGCSKPRTGAFGGGAVFVTANSIDWFNAAEWLADLLKHHERKEKNEG
jgi:hypothetical protein